MMGQWGGMTPDRPGPFNDHACRRIPTSNLGKLIIKKYYLTLPSNSLIILSTSRRLTRWRRCNVFVGTPDAASGVLDQVLTTVPVPVLINTITNPTRQRGLGVIPSLTRRVGEVSNLVREFHHDEHDFLGDAAPLYTDRH